MFQLSLPGKINRPDVIKKFEECREAELISAKQITVCMIEPCEITVINHDGKKKIVKAEDLSRKERQVLVRVIFF